MTIVITMYVWREIMITDKQFEDAFTAAGERFIGKYY